MIMSQQGAILVIRECKQTLIYSNCIMMYLLAELSKLMIDPAAPRDGSRARQVQALDNICIKLISGGWRHTIAADKDGQLYAWGWNKVQTRTSISE